MIWARGNLFNKEICLINGCLINGLQCISNLLPPQCGRPLRMVPDGCVGAAGDDEGEEELDAVDVCLVAQEAHERLRVRVVVGRGLAQVPDVWREFRV